jgi:hypothetical protein
VTLPEGLHVLIEPIEDAPHGPQGDIPSLYERLKPFVGVAKGLPPDASVNLDHYVYGVPKQP